MIEKKHFTIHYDRSRMDESFNQLFDLQDGMLLEVVDVLEYFGDRKS